MWFIVSCAMSPRVTKECRSFNCERSRIEKVKQWPSARADTARFSNFYQRLKITRAAISYMAEQSRPEFFITWGKNWIDFAK